MSADNFAVIFCKDNRYNIAILSDSCYGSDHSKITFDICMENILFPSTWHNTEEEAREDYFMYEYELSEYGSILTEYGLCGTLKF